MSNPTQLSLARTENEITSLNTTTSTPSQQVFEQSIYSDLLERVRVEKPEPPERTAARSVFALRIMARYENASGTRIDPARKDAIVTELQIARAPHAQLVLAERFILAVRARYGTLTLPDFNPTRDDLEQIGESVSDLIAAARRDEYARGYSIGREAGRADSDAEWRQNEAYLAERAKAAEAVDLTVKVSLLKSREEALERSLAELRKGQEELRLAERSIIRRRHFQVPAKEQSA